jgi:hypothetical protein
MMAIGARSIACSVCSAKPGDRCDFDAGTGWEPVNGRYHQARVNEATRATRDTDRAARAMNRVSLRVARAMNSVNLKHAVVCSRCRRPFARAAVIDAIERSDKAAEGSEANEVIGPMACKRCDQYTYATTTFTYIARDGAEIDVA